MDSSVSPNDEIWFLRVCHHISNVVYCPYTGPHGDISQTNVSEERPSCSSEMNSNVIGGLGSFLNITSHGKTLYAAGIWFCNLELFPHKKKEQGESRLYVICKFFSAFIYFLPDMNFVFFFPHQIWPIDIKTEMLVTQALYLKPCHYF
jgi:hypothetical protein